MKLTAEMVESLSGLYLSPRYDEPQPTPEFHRECWRRYCSSAPAAAIAAPRNHAKSTALTHDYILASVLFRAHQYVIVLGSSEELAIEHLGDIAAELRENEALIRDFYIKGFISEQKTDIIVECEDGYQFRIIARGAEQKIRGRKWRGKRPGLIVCDDLEDDEQVANRDRRRKFRHWFFRACVPALRDGGKIRVHGTVLHVDSLLAHLLSNPTWSSKCYRAHRAFSDFSHILWPEKFPEERLRYIRESMVKEGDSAGYSQEYLNDPRDDENAYLRREDFLPMREEDYESYKEYGIGCDFAISKNDHANRTSFTVGGRDLSNTLCHVDQRVGRWDALEILDEMFTLQERWSPKTFYVEKGAIWNALWPSLRNEMARRDIWLSITEIASIKDKASRGKSFQKRMRAGRCRFDKQASWYEEYEAELLAFSAATEAVLDDQFDSTTILSAGLENEAVIEEGDEMTEAELEFERAALAARKQHGRSAVTGY